MHPIIIDSQLLKNPDQWLPADYKKRQLVIVTDDEVKKYYGDKLVESLAHASPLIVSFSPGEQSKNYLTKQMIEEKMLQHGCDRETIILALGGGVVGDLAGFTASTYMRGISYIQIPTTLLAMVDSSVGGKTGINNAQGKNLIGSFWQPISVVMDTDCLNTLPKEHVINGLIEMIKMLLIHDKEACHYIDVIIDGVLSQDTTMLKSAIHRSVAIKSSIVKQDPNEIHLRKILNFGHTIGHALEKISGYHLLHGYAVALGILVEAKISQLSGILSEDNFLKIVHLFERLNIHGDELKKFDVEAIIQATKNDKKNKEGRVRYVLLKKLGEIFQDKQEIVHAVPDEIVKQALDIISECHHGR
jgi:3-dehydroquinate synthase